MTTITPLDPAERTRLETWHGTLLRRAAVATDFYDASMARFRAAVIAKALGWDW